MDPLIVKLMDDNEIDRIVVGRFGFCRFTLMVFPWGPGVSDTLRFEADDIEGCYAQFGVHYRTHGLKSWKSHRRHQTGFTPNPNRIIEGDAFRNYLRNLNLIGDGK